MKQYLFQASFVKYKRKESLPWIKKLVWFITMLFTMMIITIAVQYFWTGKLNPTAFLGIILGAAIGWLILYNPKKSWFFWMGMVFWVIFVPTGFLGFIRFLASQISIVLSALTEDTIFLLGILAVLLFFIRKASHFGIQGIDNQPRMDERVQFRFGFFGFWAFVFINLLIMIALLQPWIPLNQPGRWIAVLILGMVIWDANLLLLEKKGQWKTG